MQESRPVVPSKNLNHRQTQHFNRKKLKGTMYQSKQTGKEETLWAHCLLLGSSKRKTNHTTRKPPDALTASVSQQTSKHNNNEGNN